ncbi:MAG: biotin--[acetyl-CoA-carboxylase] ligase [Acidimicrobiia bacterium]|nr:biotin--[acetyl-CoA-carboxylase] ligase [Acidimicrobiia bacterium]
MATPYATVHLPSTPSTQDEARSRFEGAPLLVTTDRQTAGRGRNDREWLEAPRPLAISLAFELSWPLPTWPRLTLVAGLAAAAALDDMVSLDWPNDLVVGPRKVGGLLTEAADGVVVVGLGVNLWWPEPPPGMAGVLADDPGDTKSPDIAAAFASDLLDRASAGPDGWGRDDYRDRCLTLGGEVVWEEGAGVAVDVGEDGSLIVETEEGTIELHSSEVTRITRGTVPPMRPTE